MPNIQTLAALSNARSHKGLADIKMSELTSMRNKTLRNVFAQFDENKNRKEFVAKIHDKIFVNDAASRTINSTWYALDSIDGNIIWLVNGTDTSVDYSKLRQAVEQKVKLIICIGENTQQIHDAFDGIAPMVMDVATLKEGVHRALYNNVAKATVLFSPACENGIQIDQEGQNFKLEVNEL